MPQQEKIEKIVDGLIPMWLLSRRIRKTIIDIGVHMFDLGYKVGRKEGQDDNNG